MAAADRKSRRRDTTSAAYAEPSDRGRTGLGDFDHHQYTFEGEVERLGAFAAGARRAGGWKLVVAWIVAAAFLLPIVLGALQLVL
jgi:hypothetical protein